MTVYDYIRQRWPNHAQRIIECMNEQDIGYTHYTLIRDVNEYVPNPKPEDVLNGLFVWAGTKEGHGYWMALSQGESVTCE